MNFEKKLNEMFEADEVEMDANNPPAPTEKEGDEAVLGVDELNDLLYFFIELINKSLDGDTSAQENVAKLNSIFNTKYKRLDRTASRVADKKDRFDDKKKPITSYIFRDFKNMLLKIKKMKDTAKKEEDSK